MCERPAWEIDLLLAGLRAEFAPGGDGTDEAPAAVTGGRPDPWAVEPPDLPDL